MVNQTLQRLSENIVYLPDDPSTDRPILAAICGANKTLMIDAGASPAHVALFHRECERHQIPRADFAVISHWHWDHSFGMSALTMPTIAHVETRNHLQKMLAYAWTDEAIDRRVQEGIEIPFCAEMIKKEYPDRNEIVITLPDIVFEKRLRIDLGGLHCLVEHVGGDHSNDNSIIYVQEERTLFLGDCLGPAIYSEKRFYQPEQLDALLEKIESYQAETYFESHAEPESRADFSSYTQSLRVIASCKEAFSLDQDRLIAEVAKKFGRPLTQDEFEIIDYLHDLYQ